MELNFNEQVLFIIMKTAGKDLLELEEGKENERLTGAIEAFMDNIADRIEPYLTFLERLFIRLDFQNAALKRYSINEDNRHLSHIYKNGEEIGVVRFQYKRKGLK